MTRHALAALILIASTLTACQREYARFELDPAYRAPAQPADPPVAVRAAAPGTRHYVFTSFLDQHPPTTHLAYSNDALDWRPLNAGKPILRAKPGMRDPHLARGPEGRFHMVWTNGDAPPQVASIGYAHSDDLVTWSEPRDLPVMAAVPGVRNVWAPELFYIPDRAEWLVHFSATVEGHAPPETAFGEPVGNHRIWATTTRDFVTFSKPFVLFDPGYTCIDATILPVPGPLATTYYLIFKDERLDPRMKAMRLATGPTPLGPWSEPSDTFTRPWSEAPSAIRVRDQWIVYYDAYSRGYYGAVRSPDLINWTDITDKTVFPAGHRHGSILEIDGPTAERLLSAIGPGKPPLEQPR